MAHFMLRSIETKIRESAIARVFERERGRPDHHFRSADHGDGVRRIVAKLGQQRRHIADVSGPLRSGALHSDAQLEVRRLPPFFEFADKDEVVRRARAIEDAHPAVSGAMAQQPVDCRPKRREADAAANQQDVEALGLLDRPADAERTAQAYLVASLQSAERRAHRPDGADRMRQPIWRIGGRR